MASRYVKFTGNCPANVNRDAKYSVRYEDGSYVVGLFYRAANDELWYPTSSSHQELVARVNDIKLHFNGAPGGSFYINEYQQVLVPVMQDTDYYYAGEYGRPLTFDFEGYTISGEAVNHDGQPLESSEPWIGPHPGIPYVLKAGGRDVYYRHMLRPGVEKEVKLSACVGTEKAARLARELAGLKGHRGGRFYVNEFANAFTPKTTDKGLEYIFLQKIDLASWFPKPMVAEEELAATEQE